MTLNSADVGGRRRASARLRTLALLVSLLAIAIVTGILWQVRHSLIKTGATRERMAGTWPRSPWKNARLDVKYVGDEACATCHRDLAESYRRHPMGRSLAPIASAPEVGGDGSGGTFSFQSGRSRFTVERRDGREFHEETRLDDQGRVLATCRCGSPLRPGIGRPRRLLPRRARGPALPVAHLMVQPAEEVGPLPRVRAPQ